MIYRFDKNGRRTPYNHRPWVLWLLLAAAVVVSVAWDGPGALAAVGIVVGAVCLGMWLGGIFEDER